MLRQKADFRYFRSSRPGANGSKECAGAARGIRGLAAYCHYLYSGANTAAMPTAAPRRVGMSAFNTLLDVPEQLLATHDRLRANCFSVVSVVNARSQIDARVWLGQWARARGRPIILAPETRLEAAIAAYCARLPGGDIASVQRTANPPVLCIPGTLSRKPCRLLLRSPAGIHICRSRSHVPVVAEMVDSLLNPAMPQDLVGATLQGTHPG